MLRTLKFARKKKKTGHTGILEKVYQCSTKTAHSEKVLQDSVENIFCKIEGMLKYGGERVKHLRSCFAIFKPTTMIVNNASEDYGLSKYTQNPVKVEGNHRSVVDSPVIIDHINDILKYYC